MSQNTHSALCKEIFYPQYRQKRHSMTLLQQDVYHEKQKTFLNNTQILCWQTFQKISLITSTKGKFSHDSYFVHN